MTEQRKYNVSPEVYRKLGIMEAQQQKVAKLPSFVNPPSGVAKVTFRNVVSAAQMAYLTQKKRVVDGKKVLPNIEDIAKFCDHSPRTISKIAATQEFTLALRERGIYWSTRDGLSPEQVYTIGILTNPSDRREMNAKLKSAGISYHTYRAWLKQPTFRAAIHQIGEDMLQDHIADVNTALTTKALGGDTRAIELYYQISGRFDPARQQVQDLQNMVNLLLETIFRYVPNIETLEKISAEFESIMAGKVPQASLGAVEDIVDAEEVEEAPDLPHEEAKTLEFKLPEEIENVSQSNNSGSDSSDLSAGGGNEPVELPPGFFDYYKDEE